MNASDKHLVFRVKNQQFTIPVTNVNTIIQIPKVYQVPTAPGFILGVINVDGDIIPLIDSARKLGMGTSELFHQSQVVILQRKLTSGKKVHRLAFIVDDVSDVADVDPRKIQALPLSSFEFDVRLVDGMHKIHGEFCMQINAENFFSGEIDSLIENIELHETHKLPTIP